MEWISVKDRLPNLLDNASEDVLTFCVSDGISRIPFVNTYEKDEKYLAIDTLLKWSDNEICFRADKFYGKVTHWMPLPKPPES